MSALYKYNGEIVTLGYMQVIWFIECVKEPFEVWLEKQEKVEKTRK